MRSRVRGAIAAAMLAWAPALACAVPRAEAPANAPAQAKVSMPAVAPPAERIPFKQDQGELGDMTMRTILATCVILAVGIAFVFVLRRRGLVPAARGEEAKAVRLLQSLRIGPKASVVVVQFGARRVLLGQGEHGLTVLATEPADGP